MGTTGNYEDMQVGSHESYHVNQHYQNCQGLMKTTAVNFFKCPIWIVLVDQERTIKIGPPEDMTEFPDPIVIALQLWQAKDGQSGHYQSVLPQPCGSCRKTWASKLCTNCSKASCVSCQCCPGEELPVPRANDVQGADNQNINVVNEESQNDNNGMQEQNLQFFKNALEKEKSLNEKLEEDMRKLKIESETIIGEKETEINELLEKIRFLESAEQNRTENMAVESPASIWDVETVVPKQRERRKTTTEQKKDVEEQIKQKIGEATDLNLRIDYEIENKGAGIRVSIFLLVSIVIKWGFFLLKATARFAKGEFLCEYVGELVSHTEAKLREERYSNNTDIGSFLYFFEHENKTIW